MKNDLDSMDIKSNNEEVLNRIKEKRELWYSIKVGKDEIIGYWLHYDSLTKSVIEYDVETHIRRESSRIEYMKWIMIDMDKDKITRSYRD